jgi:hydrogenase nickel incorporation protein HypA/HybF
MHEFHIVESIAKQALEKAKDNHALKVTRVVLAMGELSGLKEGPVRLYFENFSKGTLLEGAELVIKTVAAKLKCQKCGTLFERRKGEFDCPQCGTLGLPVNSGSEFYIENIEIES